MTVKVWCPADILSMRKKPYIHKGVSATGMLVVKGKHLSRDENVKQPAWTALCWFKDEAIAYVHKNTEGRCVNTHALLPQVQSVLQQPRQIPNFVFQLSLVSRASVPPQPREHAVLCGLGVLHGLLRPRLSPPRAALRVCVPRRPTPRVLTRRTACAYLPCLLQRLALTPIRICSQAVRTGDAAAPPNGWRCVLLRYYYQVDPSL